jgi:hypothetical protein
VSPASNEPLAALGVRELRLDCLIGREVLGANNHAVGMLEEVRAERRGSRCVVTGFVLGAAGLAERLGVSVKLLFGIRREGGYLARWDQVDLSDPRHPRLTCPVDELEKL